MLSELHHGWWTALGYAVVIAALVLLPFVVGVVVWWVMG